MLDDEKRAGMDQSIAMMAEVIPSAVKQLYDGFISEGFEKDDALNLCQSYIHGLSGAPFKK